MPGGILYGSRTGTPAFEICAECETVYRANGPTSFLCPKCLRKARSKNGEKRAKAARKEDTKCTR